MNNVNKTLYLRLAGFTLKIILRNTDNKVLSNKFYKDFVKYYAGFIKTNPNSRPDFTINIIDSNRIMTIYDKDKNKRFVSYVEKDISLNSVITYYSVSITQFSMIITSILTQLLTNYQGFIFHASSLLVNGRAFLFTGNSGSGKSTIVRLLNKFYKPLADDSVILKKEGKNYYLYQTHIVDKHGKIMSQSAKYIPSHLFFLKQSDIYKIEEGIRPTKFLIKDMVEQLWTTSDHLPDNLNSLMEFIRKFKGFYKLYSGLDRNKLFKLIEKLE